MGADVGGTWARVLAVDGAGGRRRLAIRADGAAGPAALLRGAWRRWRLSAGSVSALVVASRGIWTAAERRAAERGLAPLARRVRVIADVEAAYVGALGEAPGILLLAGTGSIALGRDARGGWARAGGLGPLLGDEGSAFWIGREWLATAAPQGGAARARALAQGPDAVPRIAALAPGVLARARRGERRARAVAARAQAALARLGLDLARRLALPRPVAVSWAGRLMGDARFRAGVWHAMRGAGLAISPRPPRASAVAAAAALAEALGRRPPHPALSPRGRGIKIPDPGTLPRRRRGRGSG